MATMNHKWTDQDKAELRRLKELGWTYGTIANKMGLTEGSVSRQWATMTATPEQREKRRREARENSRKDRTRFYNKIRVTPTGNVGHRIITPTAELSRQRLMEARNHQDPISAFLGEPPPGFSALDRRRVA